MNRIFIKPIKKKKYGIFDALDQKKIGALKLIKQQPIIAFKKKVNNPNVLLKAEAQLLFNRSSESTIMQKYKAEIDAFNNRWLNIRIEKHQLDDAPDLPIYLLSCRLKECGLDMFNRVVKLHPAAIKAWLTMQKAAQNSGINLQIISAFRDLQYQQRLIENKLKKGLSITEILKVNTLPGYSEHHTGCAIDIGSKNEAILETEFDQSPAFKWLILNANEFGFYLTYPKNNQFNMIYEPWHWCYKVDSKNQYHHN